MNITFFGKTLHLPSMVSNTLKTKAPSIFRGGTLRPERDKTGDKITANSLYTVHNNSTDVAGCIKEIQNWTFKGGTRFVDPKNTDEEVGKDIKDQLNEFFSSEHSTTKTFDDFKDGMIFDREVCGNAYAYIIKSVLGDRVLGLEIMDPRTVSIVADKHGTVYKYLQETSSGEKVEFEPEEVLHWKRGKSANAPLFGFSALEPAIWEVKTDLAAMVSNYKFFENDSIPAATYIIDETLSDEEVAKAVDFMKKNHGGAENRHKSSILMGIKEIKQMQLTQKDVEFLAGRKFSRQKICGAFGVPEFLLGVTDSVNNNNGQELFRKFIGGTIEKIEAQFASLINDELFSRLGINTIVKFKPLVQQVDTPKDIIDMALSEYKSGALTLRQYKVKTGQDITDLDEKNEMIDQYIIHQGASAISIEDVGSQDLEAAKNAEAVEALIKK